jgi:positive regulator of sigma E activity
MINLLAYLSGSLFFLFISVLSGKLIKNRINSTFYLMVFVIFNGFIAAQQYSILFESRLSYDYPIDIQITNPILMLSFVFLIAHGYLIINPLKRLGK